MEMRFTVVMGMHCGGWGGVSSAARESIHTHVTRLVRQHLGGDVIGGAARGVKQLFLLRDRKNIL